jgi:hypothetical protein
MIIVQDQERIFIKPSFVYYYLYLNRLYKGLHFRKIYHDECVIIPIIYINELTINSHLSNVNKA